MRITDPRLNNFAGQPTWRNNWLQALFREEIFFVENQSRASGRRVALHQYPKRNLPYAEDMGRSAWHFVVQGYLIGRFYHELKDRLIAALEKDGPGRLRLPMQYGGPSNDVTVMVQSYTVSENRERGGMCGVEMDFVEYGNPAYRPNISTPDQLFTAATGTEKAVMGQPTSTTAQEVAAIAKVHQSGIQGPPEGGDDTGLIGGYQGGYTTGGSF
jgi:prophage DNA circulation protein